MDGLYVMKWDYRFTFGKYRAQRVDEVFNNGWYGKTYIAWAYYTKEDISFKDEVLEAVGIVDRIEKPGASPEKYYEWLKTVPEDVQSMIHELQNNTRMGIAAHRKSEARRYYAHRLEVAEGAIDKACSKGRLQWKNQGH